VREGALTHGLSRGLHSFARSAGWFIPSGCGASPLRPKAAQLECWARERQQEVSQMTMKKTSSGRQSKREEMRREYRFDYRKSLPNRFASLMKAGTVAVVLDPDVASVFRSPESVNSLLRSVIRARPKRTKAQSRSGSQVAPSDPFDL